PPQRDREQHCRSLGGAVHRLGSCAEQQDSGQDPQLDVLEGFAHSPPTVRVALQQPDSGCPPNATKAARVSSAIRPLAGASHTVQRSQKWLAAAPQATTGRTAKTRVHSLTTRTVAPRDSSG